VEPNRGSAIATVFIGVDEFRAPARVLEAFHVEPALRGELKLSIAFL